MYGYYQVSTNHILTSNKNICRPLQQISVTILLQNGNHKGKSSIYSSVNQFEIPSFSSNKQECFARTFSFNTTPETSNVNLLDFLLCTGSILRDMHITPYVVSTIVSKLGHPKICP